MECKIQIQMRAHKKVQGFDLKNQVNGGNVSDRSGQNFGEGLVHPGTNEYPGPGAASAVVSSTFLVK